MAAAAGAKRSADEDLKQTVIENLTCRICLELMASDIFQCPNGHALCGTCKAQLPGDPKKCPSCSDTNLNIRSRTLEEIAAKLEVECPHQGCTERVLVPQLKTHKEGCACAPLRCSQLYPNCDFTGSKAELLKHIVTGHKRSRGKPGFGFDTPDEVYLQHAAQRAAAHLTTTGKIWTSILHPKAPAEDAYVCRILREPAPIGQGVFRVFVAHVPGSAKEAAVQRQVDVEFQNKQKVARVLCSGVRVLSWPSMPPLGTHNAPTVALESEACLTERQALLLSGHTGSLQAPLDSLPDDFSLHVRLILK